MSPKIKPIKNGISSKRELEFFHHKSVREWGGKDQVDSFAVLHPTRHARKHGLYVVLHSAGHDLYSCLGCTFMPDNHDIYRTPDNLFGLYLDCRENQSEDFWWGGINAKGEGNPERKNVRQPVENRVYATIEWVMKQYPIDENRVYICGNSMGGSGALGLGMCRGDLFAAVKVNVPAGVQHMLDRINMAKETLPDPPICIDYSAPDDAWSEGHADFYKFMREKRFSLFGYWAPFGHANSDTLMLEKNDLIHSFDWLSVRKNQAYPVFTNAASDDRNPWENPETAAIPGQVNAFFRWKNVSDSPNRFSMMIYIDAAINTRVQIPTQTIADVTLRRIQEFHLSPGETVAWTFGTQNGISTADTHGILTLPKLVITASSKKLTLRRTSKK